MKSPLDFDRKKTLAAGLLAMLLGIFALKSLLVYLHLGHESWAKANATGALYLGLALLLMVVALTARHKPRLSCWLLMAAFPVLSLVQIRFLGNFFAMQPIIGVLAVVEQILLLLAIVLLLENPKAALQRWSFQFPRLGKWLKLTGLIVLTFSWMEAGLRGFGYGPNVLQRDAFFHQVDPLWEYGDYATDEAGIFAYSPQAIRFLNDGLSQDATTLPQARIDTCRAWHNPDLYEDYVEFNRGTVQNEFHTWIAQIEAKPAASRTELEAAWLLQPTHPLNENGFRSIPFRNYVTPQPKVLLIGDSFTWGYSASNITHAFAEILTARGYAVFNAGITGTDPAQYEAIASKYIPILRPDAVVVNFYMGNDIYYFKRPVAPYRAMAYVTNAGMLVANPGIEWLPSAAAAYDFLVEERGIPNLKGSIFNACCAQSAVSTQIWRGLNGIGIFPKAYSNSAYWGRCLPQQSAKPVSGEHLKSIAATCKQYNATFILGVIPALADLDKRIGTPDLNIPQDYPGLFDGLEIHVPPLTSADYNASDDHFNDAGHLKYADFLQGLLQRVPKRASPVAE
jgi:hypothetical protein